MLHKHTHSLTHIHTHTLSLSHTYTHTLSLSLSLSLSHTHIHTNTLTHSLTHTHTLSLTHIHTLSLSHTHTHTQTQTHTLAHFLFFVWSVVWCHVLAFEASEIWAKKVNLSSRPKKWKVLFFYKSTYFKMFTFLSLIMLMFFKPIFRSLPRQKFIH